MTGEGIAEWSTTEKSTAGNYIVITKSSKNSILKYVATWKFLVIHKMCEIKKTTKNNDVPDWRSHLWNFIEMWKRTKNKHGSGSKIKNKCKYKHFKFLSSESKNIVVETRHILHIK